MKKRHTFRIPAQEVHSFKELDVQLVRRRGHHLLAHPRALVALGLAATAALIATLTRVHRWQPVRKL